MTNEGERQVDGLATRAPEVGVPRSSGNDHEILVQLGPHEHEFCASIVRVGIGLSAPHREYGV